MGSPPGTLPSTQAPPAAALSSPSPAPSSPPNPALEAAIARTVEFVNERLREHYARTDPWMPPRFGRREWGFMYLGKRFVSRHLGFRSREELQRFLVRDVPAHAYYSTAYYETPAAPTMEEKHWLGADLIFDLDADHLPGAAGQPFHELLARVRGEAVWLVEEFLLRDFGFSKDDLRIVFSGGRGYHVHVTHPDVLPLGSPERREIVDYVTANGLALDTLVRERAYMQDEFRRKARRAPVLPSADEPGWGGRLTRAILRRVDALRAMPEEEALAALLAVPGVGEKRARETLEAVARKQAASGEAVSAVLPKPLLERWKQEVAVETAGETDEPVTSDVKRLIRHPGSIHGKTGLRVTIVPLENLPAYDPLVDAVAWSEREPPVRVKVGAPDRFRLGGREWDVAAGEHELPLAAAMFMMLRRKALFADAPV
ncbi:MAG TPA: DNA primase catalytic subunit PriS [Candidatus Thermoplasmatota archaeon]|nr:DNA primase catalytic subunit PriS [Candidatus Thermoplasmatota archaeon]